MEEKIVVESLAMDLKRVALGLHRGSLKMADKFKNEALKRGIELEAQNTNPYLIRIWHKAKSSLLQNSNRVAEDVLMYSVLFQNFAVKKLSGEEVLSKLNRD